ncbi:putative signal transducing protein [Ruminiclostridium sufflavum DSM 19573]|uniref:Putative signal transducing protein n=1 Tax=Ruminiclostridium sufflavum DSM 19573 TaxID=1121337 RepID=A0A318XRL1_9FIRM|nr:DUF2007 domain-containing protein [Ruminiclostridium sufflavum]PYG89094.1 putative signal transducing protein [Ruminiclostridium sufflavum DSM 19573]
MENNKETVSADERLETERQNADNWVPLTTAENEFEFNIIKAKLEQNNIICIGKGKDYDLLDSGLLQIVLGPCIPIEVIVPKEMYDEALQIINLKVSDEELEEQAINAGQEESGEG